MSQPEPVADLSLEEILASIRKTIGEDAGVRPSLPLSVVEKGDGASGPNESQGGAAKAPTPIAAPAEPVRPMFSGPPASAAPAPQGSAQIHPLRGAMPAAPTLMQPAGPRAAAEPSSAATAAMRLAEDQRGGRVADEPPDDPRATPSVPGETLLSAEADDAIGSAFDQLTDAMTAQPPRSLEDLVQEMMRPMLKDWLDDNLPKLVERVVREEIQRVTRGRR
ncbi:MAG: DUF2497 domain-containing protein [Bauldia sp.]